MNRYQQAMDRCVPPQGLEQRLAEQVLGGEAPGRRGAFRPKGFRRHLAAAAALLLVLAFATGAAVLWDPLLVGRFGPQAALSALGGAVFQEVHVTSVCGGVTVTIPQALVSDKTLYLILEYQLPNTLDPAEVQAAWESGEGRISPPEVHFFSTGAYTWEEFKEQEQDRWTEVDWHGPGAWSYLERETVLAPYRFTGGASSSSSAEAYDPETNTLTSLHRYTIRSHEESLGDAPLTVLISPPEIRMGEREIFAADTPALITFQPVYKSKLITGALEEGDFKARASLTPFALTLTVESGEYLDLDSLVGDTALVFQDGGVQPVWLHGVSPGGSLFGDTQYCEIDASIEFFLLKDPGEIRAVRIGSHEIPLK